MANWADEIQQLETKLTLEFEKNNRLHEQLKAERSM
jgi:hypothetical protein